MFVAFINNADFPNRFSLDGHPSISKFQLSFTNSLFWV